MNFKRFHESKNLFDSNMESGTINVYGVPAVSISRIRTVGFIEVEAGTYTLNASANHSLETYVFLYNTNNEFIERIPASWATIPYTFTITNKRKVKFIFAFAPADSQTEITPDDVSNIMLNTGSQPLPYEPYSSEVWHDIPHYIHNTSTDTITTLPADIYANDTTATVGLKGQMSQTGTPTPDSPITPSECGERTGNLFDKNSDTTNNNGYTRPGVEVPAGTYSINNGTTHHVYYRIGYSGTPQQTNPEMKTERIVASDSLYVWRDANIREDGVMLNIGSTALPYEPWGIKIPILSNSTTTPVYLGEVETTRKIKKLVLDGTENWTRETGKTYYMAITMPLKGYSNAICTHYPIASSYNNLTSTDLTFSVSQRPALFIHDNRFADWNELKSYLAQQYTNGTPVTVWYALANEETAVVNEPLRKIGDYADEVSGITIPVIAGANTLSVDTTLQPSEATVNYKGWHPVTDVHERESGAWD